MSVSEIARQLQFAPVSTATSGQSAIVAAPSGGTSLYVVSYVLVAASAVTVKWQSASTDLTGAMSLAANGGLVVIGNAQSHLFQCAPNAALNLNLGGAVQVSGHISYFFD